MLLANWLKSEAASNFRSVNAELQAILHEEMRRRGQQVPTGSIREKRN